MGAQISLEKFLGYMKGAGARVAVDRLCNNTSTYNTPASAGQVRVNTTTGALQYHDGTTLRAIVGGVSGTASFVETTLNEHNVALSMLDVTSTSTMPLFLYNAAGDRYWERTAAGAETLRFAFPIDFKRATASQGTKLTKVRVAYELATADLTSLDLRADSTVYAQAANPVITASHGGAIVDADYDSNHNTAAKRKDSTVTNGEHLLTLTFNTPAYYATANGVVYVEITVVMQNTGVFRLRNVAYITSETLG